MSAGALCVRPAAKVNLHLEVLGRRPDGYHELRTLLQSLDLRDELVVAAAPEGTLELTVEPAGAAPADGRNLVLRAAERLRTEAGRPLGARLRLVKRIPTGGGLGGGSADAAAALVALDRLWGLGLERHRLVRLGAELGADVPFFLHGGLALGVGRGDEVYPLRDLPPAAVVLVMPEVEVPTAEVYGRLGPRLTWSRPEATVEAFASGLVAEMPWPSLRNDLEAAVMAGWPLVAEAFEAARQVGGRRVAVTGSGAAVYAVMERPEEAALAAAALAGRGWRVELTSTLSRRAAALTVAEVPRKELQ